MPEELEEITKSATIVMLAVCGVWLWMKVKIDRIERERDEWKKLTFALMEKCGIDVPAELLPGSTNFRKKEGK